MKQGFAVIDNQRLMDFRPAAGRGRYATAHHGLAALGDRSPNAMTADGARREGRHG